MTSLACFKLTLSAETGRFDTNSNNEIAQKFGHRKHDKYSMCVNKENILGEYSLFFTPCSWNYLQLNWINLYRNDFVSTLSATIKPLSAMTMSPGHRLDLRPKSRDFSSL